MTTLNIASTNLDPPLRVDRDSDAVDLVAATGGDLLGFERKVAAAVFTSYYKQNSPRYNVYRTLVVLKLHA